ncbi:MAG: RDD family protein [Actinomycetes bacterium]
MTSTSETGDPGFRGARLGRPETGPGSVAGMGVRVGALAIDWFASLLISGELFHLGQGGAPGSVTLGIFFVEIVVLTLLVGGSFGQVLLRLRVERVGGGRLPLVPLLVRTVLLCLVVPPLIFDRDGRGLHDRIAGSVVVRLR